MDTSLHNINNLFLQLGLPDDDDSIDSFIRAHHHMDKNTRIDQASFWTTAQANFLSEAYHDDSDWVEVVDHLNVQLHH